MKGITDAKLLASGIFFFALWTFLFNTVQGSTVDNCLRNLNTTISSEARQFNMSWFIDESEKCKSLGQDLNMINIVVLAPITAMMAYIAWKALPFT